jgi:sugar lactone lactonase YvrE
MSRTLLVLVVATLTLNAQSFVETVAGTTWIFPSAPGPATQAPLGAMETIVADANGNLFVADPDNHVVVRIDPRGILTPYAGNGIGGYSGDNLPATQASLNRPTGLAFDAQGNLLIADVYNFRIFRVDRAGVLTTVAGGGTNSRDGARALEADIEPWWLAVDPRGIVYFLEKDRNRVRQIDANGTVRTVAGNGEEGFTPDGGAAVQAKLAGASGIALDAAGRLYIADTNNHRVRRVRADGILETFAGTGEAGVDGLNGPASRAKLTAPRARFILPIIGAMGGCCAWIPLG